MDLVAVWIGGDVSNGKLKSVWRDCKSQYKNWLYYPVEYFLSFIYNTEITRNVREQKASFFDLRKERLYLIVLKNKDDL